MKNIDLNKQSEIWKQDFFNANLWHSENGTIISEDLLKEREFYFDVIKLGRDYGEPSYQQIPA